MSSRAAVEQLRRDPLGYLTRLADEPPLARRMVGRRRVVLAVTPDAVREVLVTRRRELVKENVIDARRNGGPPAKPGLLSGNQAANHDIGRRALRPAFTREQARAVVAPHVRDEAERLAEAWAEDRVVDTQRELTFSAMRVVGRALFGGDIDDESAGDDLRAVLDEFTIVVSGLTMLGGTLHVGRGLRFTRAWGRLDELAMRLVEGPGPVATALRSVDIAPAERAAEARVILLAGAETTATALTWALLELARDPELAEAVAQEGEPLAERVFAEVLRLYPPAWYIGRIAVSDTELAGEPISEGTMVLVSPYLLHRDERHFERAATFDPGRWSDGTAAAARAFTYIPFGAGPRRCIGEEIAWLEGCVFLATLARALALDRIDELPVDPFPGASLRPSRPVLLRTRRRHSLSTVMA